MQLYGSGIAVIADATLKSHLEEFTRDFFRRELVPNVLKRAGEEMLLRDAGRSRAAERLLHAYTEARTLSEIQGATQRFAKKIKLEQPSGEALAKIKGQTLQQKLKGMRKMPRGSDLLQNLIWVLLARSSGGLLLSSRKDTSRMIKLCQILGDAEMGRKLEGWRDLLKGGKQSGEDLEEMRKLGVRVVEERCWEVEAGR